MGQSSICVMDLRSPASWHPFPDKNRHFPSLIELEGNQSDIWVKNVVIKCDRLHPNRGRKRADLISNPRRPLLHLTSYNDMCMCACVCVCVCVFVLAGAHRGACTATLNFLLLLSQPDSHHTSSIRCELKQSVDVLFSVPLTPTLRFKTDSLTKVI